MIICRIIYGCICTCEGRNHRQGSKSCQHMSAGPINYINVPPSVVKTLPPIQINMKVYKGFQT